MGARVAPLLALSQGDPAGIGPDIALMAWSARQSDNLPAFLYIGDPEVLAARAALLGLDVPIREADADTAAALFDHSIPVLPVPVGVEVQPGMPNKSAAPATIRAIELAVDLTMTGKTAAVVTNPIAKSVLYEAGFTFPGHTEFLAELDSRASGRQVMPVMMIAGPELRTVPVTIHIPLSEVPGALTTDLIYRTCRITAEDLKLRFGIAAPRLAISGLNPHAGENGALGLEDDAVILPAIRMLQAEGIDAVGPLPADTMFHAAARQQYDVAICMYHDQALIPAKALAFDDGVNVTLGLSFIRTSPDHGTAFSLAGTGKARPSSLIAALKMAAAMKGLTHGRT